ncbi:GNAT family N-acetyltransferase [Paenibacillus endoradicis]|uniref:GNAT family N-acetyltransferase n=1 Tax=Paenibacillus endoradicis TaxID=2972487 RepID=UPI0021597C8D|nr:GNAT family N-acetyltransferase [Paenibacillus endoradicis]MCR8658983.1 GNAT family N-acetyltransferase [Paenibacillus endoradicis]
MIIEAQQFNVNGLAYTIRSASKEDAKALSDLRLQIDGETENLDREQGEAYIDISGFEEMIKADSEKSRNLFLVATVLERIVAFSRCEGIYLKRFSHKVEFGVCVLQQYWGNGIGGNLLKQSIRWADSNEILKMTLNVLETNDKAIKMYTSLGFEVEGILKKDKILADNKFYNTLMMGRIKDSKLNQLH